MCVPRFGLAASVLLIGFVTATPSQAVFIGNSQGGTDFPEGAASFADALVDYSPVIVNGEPTAANRDPIKALGLPDYISGGGCTGVGDCTFVSIGDGGSITLRFVDNVLTGSDSAALDLWVFEVGPDIEDTFIEVSSDGSTWFGVGKVFGSTAGIDIDAFGFDASSSFGFVRLTDDPDEGDQTGISVGADIDAVGAITTRIVPEPTTIWLLGSGVVFLIVSDRRQRKSQGIDRHPIPLAKSRLTQDAHARSQP